MPSAFLNLARSLALLAVFFICGGQWMALQTVAWSRMLADFAQRTTLVQAVSQTFDGEHPCTMCMAVESGSSKQKSPEIQLSTTKLVMVQPAMPPWLFPPSFCRSFALMDITARPRADAPPVPPPRASLS